MVRDTAGENPGRANWRRKWKRVPAERRLAAATSLGDVFRRRRLGGLTPLFLLLSLAVHVPAALFLKTGREGMDIEAAGQAESYLRQVIQKERATSVSRDLSQRITMPPPPPDPESAVKSTLTADITTDIQRVIGKMLDVDVTSKLTAGVTADLRTELAEAAKQIAEGKLSQKEIRNLQEHFKRKAHRKTVTALQKHRVATQVQHAKVSVNEWYEERVSLTLRGRMRYDLFTRPHGRIWPGHFTYHRDWGFVRSDYYGRKVSQLDRLARGQHSDRNIEGKPIQHGGRLLPDWPGPSAKQADALLTLLGGIQGQSRYSSTWDDAVSHYLKKFYPHRREEVAAKYLNKASALWEKAFDQAEAYKAKADAGADEKDLAVVQQACLTAIRELHGVAAKVVVSGQRQGQVRVVNQAVRSRVLRGPAREQMYRRFVNTLLVTLAPAVRDMAENEFGEGIIVRQQGIDGLTKEFADQVLAYLRRDVEKAFPKRRFDERIFDAGSNPYKSKVTGKSCPPDAEDIARDEKALAAVLAAWPEADRNYPEKRGEVIIGAFGDAVDRVANEVLARLTEDGRMRTDFYASVESVDYTDKVRERLDARARALGGRGQDMAKLTDEGVPDTSAPMIALMLGAAGGRGAPLEPIMTTMLPRHVRRGAVELALRAGPPRFPSPPMRWARMTQPEVSPDFDTPCCEGIPFLSNFPRLDGDLSDWGRIRPLLLRKARTYYPGPVEPICLYAAWNYQGFFFGYHVPEPAHRFAYPRIARRPQDVTGVVIEESSSTGWAYSGDYLRVMFDTLDARGERRGEPHTQEFVIFPRGTEQNPNIPGLERTIKSTRDAHLRGPWGGHAVDSARIFPPQPSVGQGPDGTGPFRVARLEKDGYTVETFLPRTLFNVPVFCPGWYVGFDCVVAFGPRPTGWGPDLHGKIWCPIYKRRGRMRKDVPEQWGDLLLLGTDPYMTVQEADQTGSLARAVVPGHSYLLTVVDPDRNIHLAGKDTVVVSAEVSGSAGGAPAGPGDVEVFLLTETGNNTSVFRGYVDTQPGRGREVQGVIEAMPGQEVRFGYVDLANARGDRNVIYHLKLPVVAGISNVLAKR